jgi:urea transporter
MDQPINGWENACKAAWPLRFVDINLRGIGQVLFQDNPLSGLLFFIAIGWGSYAADAPQVAIGGLLALIVATLTALWLRVDAAALHAGLYGFNAFLVGIALTTFLALSPLLWVYVVLGGAVSVVATLAMTVTTRPRACRVRRREPSGWRGGDCSRDRSWSGGSWRCGNRPRRSVGFGSSRRLSA